MRIVGGTLKARNIITPRTRDTRPVTDYTREAIFDILKDVNGYSVLDCYAGSGALGLEALSRGASTVEAIEKSPSPAKIIKDNLRNLGLQDSYRLYKQSVSFWAKTHRKRYGSYDLIFVDQPFTDMKLSVFDLIAPYLKPTGTLIALFPKRMQVPPIVGLNLTDKRQYGDSVVALYELSQ